jgi:hypothetical protein
MRGRERVSRSRDRILKILFPFEYVFSRRSAVGFRLLKRKYLFVII